MMAKYGTSSFKPGTTSRMEKERTVKEYAFASTAAGIQRLVSQLIDFTVKEGEVFQAESSLLDFLGISRREHENMKLSGWKFNVYLKSNDDKHPFLVEQYGDVKSSGLIAFSSVSRGECNVYERFQVEVINTPDREDWPSEEQTYLHRKVPGSNYSVLYFKQDEEVMHVSWWRDPTSREVHRGVNSFDRI